ncbi:MAG: hypothetical protein OQK82_05650 [Candidatus Pacearchaeota archaeon]|nr:hypothetical protein [Candidatus Pacearchaeota archaeon]
MDKETKELHDAVMSLWNSPVLKNKEIALSQLHFFDIPKSKFIWNDIKSKWSKKNIIKNWTIAYADGKELSEQGEIELFKMDFMCGELRIIDMSHAVFLESPHYKQLLKLGDWGNAMVDEMYSKVFKGLKKMVFSHTELLLPDNA